MNPQLPSNSMRAPPFSYYHVKYPRATACVGRVATPTSSSRIQPHSSAQPTPTRLASHRIRSHARTPHHHIRRVEHTRSKRPFRLDPACRAPKKIAPPRRGSRTALAIRYSRLLVILDRLVDDLRGELPSKLFSRLRRRRAELGARRRDAIRWPRLTPNRRGCVRAMMLVPQTGLARGRARGARGLRPRRR